jgi:hypothetical protein
MPTVPQPDARLWLLIEFDYLQITIKYIQNFGFVTAVGLPLA